MRTKTVETLTWVLIYSGLLAMVLALFVREHDPVIGHAMLVAGGLDTLAGAVLVWWRSRMTDNPKEASKP
jgi:hypothetical protein